MISDCTAHGSFSFPRSSIHTSLDYTDFSQSVFICETALFKYENIAFDVFGILGLRSYKMMNENKNF